MMEIEKTPPKMAKKMWNLVRITFYTMRKGISKSSKLMLDLDFLIKRGKIASKAIGDLMIQHHRHHYYSGGTLSCRYEDDILSSFISPREYEFSCSNSPAYPYHHSRRKSTHTQHHDYYRPEYGHRRFHRGQDEEIDVLHKVLDILDHSHEYPVMGLPGLGNSPLVRQLRVTDSPFAVNDHTEEENHQVDKDAEKFIKRFYKDLRNQRRIAALESPVPCYHM